MKKFAIATLMAVAMASAGAVEVGVVGGESFHTDLHANNTMGLTLGEKFGKVGVTLEADHNFSQKTATNADRYSLIGSYDVAKVGHANIAVKAGVDYLSQRSGSTLPAGYGLLAGAGVTVPVTKQVSVTADYRYDAGQERVKAQNVNQVLVGIKYAF
jgi:opacity protein-like surface antigen